MDEMIFGDDDALPGRSAFEVWTYVQLEDS